MSGMPHSQCDSSGQRFYCTHTDFGNTDQSEDSLPYKQDHFGCVLLSPFSLVFFVFLFFFVQLHESIWESLVVGHI